MFMMKKMNVMKVMLLKSWKLNPKQQALKLVDLDILEMAAAAGGDRAGPAWRAGGSARGIVNPCT